MDSTIKEINEHIRRMWEINEEFKRIIKENDKIINPQKRNELRGANEWFKGI